jgi:glycosyltransferase 2 family protein
VASLGFGDDEVDERPDLKGVAGHVPSVEKAAAPEAARQHNPVTRAISRSPRGFERVRRPSDLLLAIFGFAVVVLVLALVRALPVGSTELTNDVSGWLRHIPRWLAVGAASVASVGCSAFVIVALSVLVRREARGALNACAAAAVAAGAAIVTTIVWHIDRGPVEEAVLQGKNSTSFVIDTAFVAFLVASDLVRRSRWARWCVVAGASLLVASLADDALTPFAFLVVLFAGLFFGWGLRWLLGAGSVRPSTNELVRRLGEHQLFVHDLHPTDRRRRSDLSGVLVDGSPVEVRMANRDTRGSGLARRLWARARLRPLVAGHVALSSRSQLEQLALSSYLANGAGVLAPSVLLMNELAAETLVLVLAKPEGEGLRATGGLEAAKSLFLALRSLHDSGVAHRDLRVENLLVAEASAGFSSLDAALPGAGELVRRLDVTQLLTTLGGVVGPAFAVEALRSAYAPEDEAAIASTLQPIALAPWGWTAMREARGCLAEVRVELLGPDSSAPTARLERFRWRTVISAIALTVAAFLLVGQISQVNLLGALRRTNFGWFALAIVGSAVTYFAAAENLAAFVPARLSPIRGFFVQLSSAFVGVAMPPTVGHVAVNARYLHRQRVDEGAVAAAIALSQIVNVVSTVILLIIFGLLTGTGVSRFKIAPSTDLLLGLGGIAVVAVVLLVIPRTRTIINHRVLPRLKSVWPRLLEAISKPIRLLWGVGANLLLTLGYLVAFLAALLALGAHPAILPAAVVYLAGNAVGSAAPTPGGLGAVEAVLTAGLTAIGIPAHEAIPAVLVFRVATFWLPIPAGWVAFVMLQRNGTL